MQDGSMEMRQKCSKELVKLIVGPESYINGVAEYGSEGFCHFQNALPHLVRANEAIL